MEVKFHFGLQCDKNDLQRVDDRLLFYAPKKSKNQIVSSFFFFPSLGWLIPTSLSIVNAHPDLLKGGQGLKQE